MFRLDAYSAQKLFYICFVTNNTQYQRNISYNRSCLFTDINYIFLEKALEKIFSKDVKWLNVFLQFKAYTTNRLIWLMLDQVINF